MATDFREFLRSSKTSEPVQKQKVTAQPQVVENKHVGFGPTDRAEILKEKTAMFCKKFGDFGMDSLDDFFKEHVERMLGTSITETTTVASRKPNAVMPQKKMNLADHASAILDGTEFDPSNANLPTAPIVENEGIPIVKPVAQNDIMSKAMALLD